MYTTSYLSLAQLYIVETTAVVSFKLDFSIKGMKYWKENPIKIHKDF